MSNNKLITALKSSSVKDIFAWTRGVRLSILLFSLGNMLFTGLSLWLALISKEIIDAAQNGDKSKIISTGILLASIILLQIVLWYFLSRSKVLMRTKFITNMRAKMLAVIMQRKYADVEKYHSGELVNRMFSDVAVVSDGIFGIIPPILSMLTQLVGAFVILARINLSFVLLLVIVAFLAFVTTLLFRKKSKQLHKNVQEKEGEVHAILQESLQNIKLIKASESENHIENSANIKLGGYLAAQIKRLNFVTFANAGLHFVFRFSWLYAMLWGAFNIFSGHITYGDLTAILQLVGQIQSPFANMSGLLSQFYSTLSSAERIKELYDLPQETKKSDEGESASEMYEKFSDISLDNMSFSYGRSTANVLENVSFSIKKGDFTAVTGLSGGGKSTLFLLLLGIYNPTCGTVSINLGNEKVSAGADTRCLFAYVPQGNALFSGTLRENISMFCENATDEQIKDAARVACIDDFIEGLPDTYETVIGERGLGLSEGQAQRIAVARAVLGNSPILLLDEATSALDEITEGKLLANISALKNRTCFIVTHRKAALSICNRRIVLNDGNITVEDI